MRGATRVTVASFGAVAALAGIEHGIGEIRQGNRVPEALVIESWPDAEPFRILQGEPALTVIPNLFVTGILAILASLVFLVWAILFAGRRHGGPVLVLLSLVMLLVGAGFGPPLLGIILGAAATRITTPLAWGRGPITRGARRVLAALWPWALGAGIAAWLLVFPGTVIAAWLLGADGADTAFAAAASAIMVSAFGLLTLTIVAGFAFDVERRTGDRPTPATGRMPAPLSSRPTGP